MGTPYLKNSISKVTDFDLHGLVGIRVVGAATSEIRALMGQLGLAPSSLDREPDIVIKYQDRLPNTSRMRCLGVDDAYFNEDVFVILGNNRQGTKSRVQIPFDQIGKHCEIVCEAGLQYVPLLIPIINLTMLSKGFIALHASAFSYEGGGVIVTGWAKGGKTEVLLAFTERGATYIGDEWVYVSQDGERLYGIPQPITLWDWHLKWLPGYRRLVSREARVRLRALRFAGRIGTLVTRSRISGNGHRSMLRKALPVLQRQLYVKIPTQMLFGGNPGALSCSFDKLFFIATHEAPQTVVEPIAAQEVTERMVFSLKYERLDLISQYIKFRFAFPEKSNPLIERAEELEREILSRALATKQPYAVFHPYPVPISDLFNAIQPYIDEPAVLSQRGEPASLGGRNASTVAG